MSCSVVQVIVLKVDIACKICKKKLLMAVSGLEGMDKIEVDAAKGTLTVTGNADPCEVIVRVRKATCKYVEVVTIGPPPKPSPTKPKPDCGAITNKEKDCLPSRSCHSCERVFIIRDYPDVSCSIL